MRPLPVLILVLAAIAATVVIVLFQRDTGQGQPVAPSPAEQPATPNAGAPVERIDTPVAEPDRTPTGAAELVEDDPEGPGIVNNRLLGRVVNDKDQPLAGATVKLSLDAMMGESISNDFFTGRQSTGKYLETQTDAKGEYVFRAVEPGRNYYLMATHKEYSAAQEEGLRIVRSGEIRAPDLVLRAGSRLYGTVVAVDGQAITNAVLHLDSAYNMGIELKSPDRLTASTDAGGNYEFKNVSPGGRILSCWAEGFENKILDNFMFTGEVGEQKEQPITLALGHPIAGRVFGPEQEGIKGATITALAYGAGGNSRGEALTDDDGNFQVEGLSQGSYMLMIQAVGYRQAKQNRVQVGDLNLQIEMIRQNTVTGHVVDLASGQPIENYTVQVLHVSSGMPAQGSQLITYEPTTVKQKVEHAADGAFTLIGVDPGMFALKVTATSYASKVTDSFTVVDGAPTAIEIRLSKGGSIKGRVVDAATGKPVAGAQVSSHDGDAPGSIPDDFFEGLLATRATEKKTRTNADGFYALKLLSAGRYRVKVEHADYSTEWIQNVVVLESQIADAGSTALHGGGTLSGKVVDSSGKPCARALVRLFNNMTNESFSGRTDAEGRYSIDHVTPGVYNVMASRASGAGGFDALAEQQASEVQIQVFEGQTASRDLTLGS